ncbi:cytochrome c oxidase assembly protein [Novosphingobium panipatense]
MHQAGERSFGAHMFEHEVIMLAAAPLLILAEPLAIMLWGLPVRYRHVFGAWSRAAPVRRSWRFLVEPVTATLLQAAVLWVWHAPALFDLALAHEGWHAAQHLSFLVSALLFWTAMLSRRTNPALAALCLVVTSIVSGALGALMAFATSPWYEGYERLGLAPFGMTPAEDQQLAGLLMWVPGASSTPVQRCLSCVRSCALLMSRRPIPASLRWLAFLVALCIAVAAGTGAMMYVETQDQRRIQAEMVSRGDWQRGRSSIKRYGCGSCHVIPGIDGAVGKVGPDLTHVGQRAAIAGSQPNTPKTLALWLMHPQALRPGSGMPEQGITPQQARDISAYLYAQK